MRAIRGDYVVVPPHIISRVGEAPRDSVRGLRPLTTPESFRPAIQGRSDIPIRWLKPAALDMGGLRPPYAPQHWAFGPYAS